MTAPWWPLLQIVRSGLERTGLQDEGMKFVKLNAGSKLQTFQNLDI